MQLIQLHILGWDVVILKIKQFSADGRNQLWCKTIRQGEAYHESICDHSNFLSTYFLPSHYVSAKENSLYVYYNIICS